MIRTMLLVLGTLGLLGCAEAGELGRLFYTPQQRQQLEFQQAQTGEASSGGRGHIIVNGVVQRQGGNRTVWINGVPQTAGRSNDKTPASVPVTVPGKSRPVQVKVGQRLLLEGAAPNSREQKPTKPSPEDD